MAVGIILKAEQAETILQKGQADLIAIGRQSQFNPNIAHHWAHDLGINARFEDWSPELVAREADQNPGRLCHADWPRCAPPLSSAAFPSLGGRSEEISQVRVAWGKAVAVSRYQNSTIFIALLRSSTIPCARW
jgi:hypothetical protein